MVSEGVDLGRAPAARPSTGSATIKKGLSVGPWCSALEDGVGVGKELPGAGGESLLVRFPGGDQALVELA